jgi:hypothetical protein
MAPTTGGHFYLSFMHVNIYLDESGDTGWRFDQPYTRGGSSRYLVIAACIVSTSADHKPERVLRNLYKNRFREPQHWQIIQDRIQLKKLFFD